MVKSSDPTQQFLPRLSFIGRSHGAVKSLGGFRKPHHTVPAAVNATTTAFLGQLCAGELAQEGEGWFQRAKAALGYKRTELSLELTAPLAVLVAKDFTLEILYALERTDPSAYGVTRTLHGLRSGALVERPEFNGLFAGTFSGLGFGLAQGARVEAVIDAVEAGHGAGGLAVSYPSDCRHCVLTVAGVAAEVVCDGATLELRFPRPGAPRELVEAFAAVRAAFTLTKNPALAGLL
jgi:hypothetical protein